ncbi:MAG: Reverse transcriptase [uncultured Sulfurovum sp.]|uniref:Reverse transcriptase n=1 Tax=uncultured Sulfurovum sp. TaxID=269237 RepID=A0A6S6U0B9_9BACT|nr:MAG: Reverse transcriptase [uncultured Sulfurovum sp.]
MIKIILTSVLTLVALDANSVTPKENMPIKAKPGQCFTKSFYPPQYTKTTKTKSTKKVIVNESSVKYEVIPAKYSIYEERVKISDGKEKILSTATEYKTIEQRILIQPKEQVWRQTNSIHAPKAFNSCVDSAIKSGMSIENVRPGTCYYEHLSIERPLTATAKILSTEATERFVATPAKYRTITKKIMTDSTSVKLLPSAATYKKVKDKVVVEPAHTEWKKTTCDNRGCNESEVVCLTEVPTTYKEVTKKIMLTPSVAKKVKVTPTYKTVQVEEIAQPATVRRVEIPAKYTTVNYTKKNQVENFYWDDESSKNMPSRIRSQCDKICLTETPARYKTVKKKVVLTPATTKKIKTKPQYTMVKIKKIEEEASFKKVVIPAEYITVVTEKERTKGYSKWMPMICESNITPNMVKKVQKALQLKGFYMGEVSGIWDLESKSAAREYQREKGLAITSKLSIETMTSLGIY